jgi:hypothetical protein
VICRWIGALVPPAEDPGESVSRSALNTCHTSLGSPGIRFLSSSTSGTWPALGGASEFALEYHSSPGAESLSKLDPYRCAGSRSKAD